MMNAHREDAEVGEAILNKTSNNQMRLPDAEGVIISSKTMTHQHLQGDADIAAKNLVPVTLPLIHIVHDGDRDE